MKKKRISRIALGNVAALGDLYDAHTDNFLAISAFRDIIPDEALKSADIFL